MRRSAWIWTAGLLLVAMALPTAGLIRWFDCETCGGLYRKHVGISVAGLIFEPKGCPDCGDRGRMSALTRWKRRPVDARLRSLIQAPSGHRAELTAPFQALVSLLRDAGTTPRFERWPLSRVTARFFVCDGEDVVLVLAQPVRVWTQNPGEERWHPTLTENSSQLWMFDVRGKLLDSVAARGTKAKARPVFAFAPRAEGEGVVATLELRDESDVFDLEVLPAEFSSSEPDGVQVWQQDVGDLPPAQWIQEGKACFRIAGGKFVRIPPR